MKSSRAWFVALIFTTMFLLFFVAYALNPWKSMQMVAFSCALIGALTTTLAVIGGYQVGAEDARLDRPLLTPEDLQFDALFQRGPRATGASFQDNDGEFHYRTREQHELILQGKGVYK